MLLHPDPSLAEVPDFSADQLRILTRNVERKQLKLEDDIKRYISQKQAELRDYEQELLAQHRPMEGDALARNANEKSSTHHPSALISPSPPPASSTPPPEAPEAASTKLGPAETAKRTKHTRVHKREQELCGLVTPIFLPLLEAGTSPTQRKKKELTKAEEEEVEAEKIPAPIVDQGSPSRDADQGKDKRGSRSRHSEETMERGERAAVAVGGAKEVQKSESARKSKRSAVKKSSLRHNTTPRQRRKRVSLVIDDQIVLPADSIAERPLTSPSEASPSTASNSTASLEDAIDPRLMTHSETPIHQDPVHHSLPLPTSLPINPPTSANGRLLPDSPAHAVYEPPQSATRTFLDPSPASERVDIPLHASATPIYADEPAPGEAGEHGFSTYVGGLAGSGVDDVDQAGSYGYPSSLGASYLESYMQTRPLSVRIAAAEKAELGEHEKKRLVRGEEAQKADIDPGLARVDDADADDDAEVMGEMDDY